MPSHFIILSSGCSGSSLLHGFLKAHPDTAMEFERQESTIGKSIEYWKQQARMAEADGEVYGNKIVIEQVLLTGMPYTFDANYGWHEADLFAILGQTDFKVIWNTRCRDDFIDSWNRRMKPTVSKEVLTERWHRSDMLAYSMQLLWPDRVCINSFEQLVYTPETVLKGLCEFLDIPYREEILIEGPRQVVPPHYQYGKLVKEKAGVV